ncbi:MAG: alpha/beta hydrolase family protein [Firmicutes bacterium]|nr:alpha/beta hydrolase family protein [Bacillota bacterium]
MAWIQCHFYSDVLQLSTSMTVILPQQTRTQIGMSNRLKTMRHKTLWLLHGLSDDDTIWMRRTSLERYVAPLGIAVVMPQVHQSFYTDMRYGNRYWTFLTEELPDIARSFFPLSDAREDNFVAGLSMGGYGAFKWALRHPEMFCAAASLSGVLDLAQRIKSRRPDDPAGRLFPLIFGTEDIAGSEDDLLALVKRVATSDGPKPLLFQACGTEDALFQENLTFRATCETVHYPLTSDFGPGQHDWAYWDQEIQKVLAWLPL